MKWAPSLNSEDEVNRARRRLPNLGMVLLFLLGSPLWAANGGIILGTVTDPRGAAVPEAKVTATETSTGVKETIATDGQGFYARRTTSSARPS